MTWLDSIENAEGVRAIFRALVPRLEAIRLHEVILQQDGPTVILRFDLAEFPELPPHKWIKAGHNTVQLKLALDVTSKITIEGWTRNNIGALHIVRSSPKGVCVEFRSDDSRLSVECEFARIDAISAYRDQARSGACSASDK
jgi:hypothetical protein